MGLGRHDGRLRLDGRAAGVRVLSDVVGGGLWMETGRCGGGWERVEVELLHLWLDQMAPPPPSLQRGLQSSVCCISTQSDTKFRDQKLQRGRREAGDRES